VVLPLEDVGHVGIAIVISTPSTGRIHEDLADGITGFWIEPFRAALQFESAVYGVHRGVQLPLDLGLCRI